MKIHYKHIRFVPKEKGKDGEKIKVCEVYTSNDISEMYTKKEKLVATITKRDLYNIKEVMEW